MLCNYDQASYFKDVFQANKDFGWSNIYEIPEDLQKEYDPVGFYYFHRKNVNPILADLRQINKRVDLRDLLRDMDRIWRFNNQAHRIINEPDWTDERAVAKRVDQLTQLTRKRLCLENRVENQVSSDVIRAWEYQEPLAYPAVPKGTLSGQVRLTHPTTMDKETDPLFMPVGAFDKRVYIKGAPRGAPN